MKNTEVAKEWLLEHGGICNEFVCDVCGEKAGRPPYWREDECGIISP